LLFASDVAVWNIAIQNSSYSSFLACQFSLLWVGIISYVFLNTKPATNFLIGTTVALFGMAMLVGFKVFLELDLTRHFIGRISRSLYSIYLLMSKKVLSQMDVLSFMTISILSSTVFLGIVCTLLDEPFFGFSDAGWFVLFIQAVVCQLTVGYQLVTLHNTCEPPGFH
jgi:hypothetical protein